MKILKFYADWCGPCKALSNALAGIEGDLAERNVKLENINADDKDELAADFGVRGLPTTLIIAEDGETVLFRKPGMYSKEDLLAIIDELQKPK
ncbi:thioredoxin C-1 [Chryseobacterium phage MA9V-1]|nr:thioredoxin C-1 [Chryseobacterium phage MA9V-1]